MAEQLEEQFGLETLADPKHIVLNGVPIPIQCGGWSTEVNFDAALGKLLWPLVGLSHG